jgi:hypothetical protein
MPEVAQEQAHQQSIENGLLGVPEQPQNGARDPRADLPIESLESQDRKWFEKNGGKLGVDKGRKASSDDGDSDLDPSQDDQELSSDEDGNDEQADVRELQKLHRQAAKRLGLSDETLKTLSPQALAELYEHKRTVDREHSKGTPKSEQPKAEQQAASNEGDLDVDKLTEAFVKITDDSFHGPIKAMVAPLVTQLNAMRTASSRMEQQYSTLVEAMEEQTTSQHRASLLESFPQLKSDKLWASVKLDANELAQTSRFKGKGLAVLPQLLRAAAAARFAGSLTKAANESTQRIANAQRAGSMTHTGRGAPVTLSAEERDRRAAFDLMSGDSAADVKRRHERATRN